MLLYIIVFLTVSSAHPLQAAFTASICESGCPVYIRAPDPVCGADGKEYYDECRAKCAGVKVVPCPSPSLCVCTKIYKPVCGDGKEFGNECMARCSDAKDIVDGPCPTPNPACICLAIYKPVCSNGKEFSNECVARCAGAKKIRDGPCPCGCQKIYKPVCGSDGVTYGNRCLARCAGVKLITWGSCCPPCAVRCSDVYDPVCADGVTYTNRCLTSCLCPRPKSIVPGECRKHCC